MSGNHGRSSTDPAPVGIGHLTPSTTPLQSAREFVAPASVPVKKTPDITDIIEVRKTTEVEPQPNGEQKYLLLSKEKVADDGLPTTDRRGEMAEEKVADDGLTTDFPSHWHAMFEQIFSSIPIIYYPLKESLPEIHNNIIKVLVKNEIQKEHFEAKIRDVLGFLRTHFNEKIEDIVVETNEQFETKKIIYDIKDKLQNFKEQNEEFEEFLQILDLKIKD